MKTLKFLNANINPNMSLLSIIDTFGRMCRTDADCKDEMFLFESGAQVRNSEKIFLFSMVRQFSCDGDELIQLHLDVSYRINEKNKNISECSWHENYGNMIQAALFSKSFELCKNCGIIKIDIWEDKT
ncbi:MAG: hypothetical protein IJO03_06210 [Clostridia bacterium]|nr:hypothetical protein [Clostridia bacterium]